MQKSQNLQPVTHRTIYVNGQNYGQFLTFNPNITFDNFLAKCSQSLKLEAKYLYDKNFNFISSIEQLLKQKRIFVTSEKIAPNNMKDIFQNKSKVRVNSLIRQSAQNKFKAVIMGLQMSGKTQIINQYMKNQFTEEYNPTFLEKKTKNMLIKGVVVSLEIYDTPGSDTLIKNKMDWIEDKDAIIFVYSVDSRESYNEINIFIEVINKFLEQKKSIPQIALVANKIDLDKILHKITQKKGQSQADLINAKFFEVSAKNNQNINQLFEKMITRVIRKYQKSYENFNNSEEFQGETSLDFIQSFKSNADYCQCTQYRVKLLQLQSSPESIKSDNSNNSGIAENYNYRYLNTSIINKQYICNVCSKQRQEYDQMETNGSQVKRDEACCTSCSIF